MATEEMNVDERYKYLRLMQDRYRKADRLGKAGLLDEAQAVTGLERKHLIACLNSSDLQRHRRNRERSRVHGAEVEHAVHLVADTLGWLGIDRLQPGLAGTAEHLARFGHLSLSTELLSQLQTISISTVRRMMGRIAVNFRLRSTQAIEGIITATALGQMAGGRAQNAPRAASCTRGRKGHTMWAMACTPAARDRRWGPWVHPG